MATVTGTINGPDGTKDVALNNAATESTLKALLSVANVDSALLKAMAAKAGVDQTTLDELEAQAVQTADNLATTSISSTKLTTAQNNLTFATNLANVSFYGLIESTKQLATGQATMSGVLANFANMPGILGDVVKGFVALVAFQETNFKSYQAMSSAGVNFSGSLTNMRMAAQNSYMTLESFSKLMTANSESLAKMGGTANDGAVAFAKVSNGLISSDLGSKLLALGYTTDQVNDGLVNYIAISGGRTAEEMKNTKALAQGAAEYLTELDSLAEITGKSREQQEQALKEESANQAYQSYLLTLDEEGKKKANVAMAEALAKGGKGAAQALQSQLMGLPPMTKAAQEFTAVAPKMAAANNKMANAVNDASKGVGDIKKAGNELGVAANQTKKDLNQTGNALIMQGGTFSQTIGTIFGTANRNAQQGVNNLEDAERQRKEIGDRQAERAESQAATMAETDKNLKELGQSIMTLVSPIVSLLTPVIGFLADHMKLLGTLMAAYIGYQLIINREKAKEAASGLASSVLDKIKNPLGGGGTTPAPPAGTNALAGAGGGGGSGFVSFIRSLGRSLASLAPIAVPMLIGAGAVAGVIAILGAGVAAAIALVGVSLPVFAKGLGDFGKIDGTNLIKVAAGIGALGVAMVAFSAGSVVGGLTSGLGKVVDLFTGGGVIGQIQQTVAKLTPILPQLTALGPAINTYAQGIVAFGKAVNTVDIGKAEKLRAVLKPTATEALQNAGTQLIQAATKLAGGGNSAEEKTHSEMQALNNTMKDMLKYIKDTAENTKRTHDATKALNGNLFAA